MFSIERNNGRVGATIGVALIAVGVVASASVSLGAYPPVEWCQTSVTGQYEIAVAPDGSVVASAGAQSNGALANLNIWDPATGDPIRVISLPGYPAWLAISSQGYAAVGISSGQDIITVYDYNTGDYVLTILDPIGHMTGGEFSKDGTKLVVNDWGGMTVRTYTIPEGAVIRNIMYPLLPSMPDSVTWSPDGDQIAVGGHNPTDPTVSVWKIPQGDMLHREVWEFNPAMSDVEYSHDGSLLAATASSGFLRMYNTSTWDLVLELDSEQITGSWSGHEFAFTPDDSLVLWGVDPNPVAALMVRVADGEVLATYDGGCQGNVIFMPDGLHWFQGRGGSGVCMYKNEFFWVASDLNVDDHVDQDDYQMFFDCMTGPGGEVAVGCDMADLDADNDVDLDDYARFSLAFPR